MTSELPVGQVITGDSIEVMATWPAASVSAVVCDPPYGLEFMGREWDTFSPSEPTRRSGWAQAEPGARINPDAAAAATPAGRTAIAYGKRRQTFVCDTCGKRDAFRNPHGCPTSTWTGEWVDALPLEALSYQEWCRRWAVEALRIAKPGAHLLAFGGTRTYHRLACAIEDAGWEVRDCLVWGYAQGFPKSLNVGKAIDRIITAEAASTAPEGAEAIAGLMALAGADDWQGWGTALKPAWEPIILARKPLTGSVARNVLDHGTGALNIDASRIPMDPEDVERVANMGGYARADWQPTEAVALEGSVDGSLRSRDVEVNAGGRWPANIVLTYPIFDGGTPGVVGGGESDAGAVPERTAPNDVYQPMGGYERPEGAGLTDAGTYSRFFLVPKANRTDREPVVRGQLPRRVVPNYQPTVTVCECGERWKPADGSGLLACGHPVAMYHYEPAPKAPQPRENTHPTVKPLELMRHLVRLVTPPGGVVLDPFLGSGTTAVAAELEGFPWLGIERDPESVAIAEARLHGTQRGLGLDADAPTKSRSRAKGHWPKARPAHVAETGFGFTDLDERTAS